MTTLARLPHITEQLNTGILILDLNFEILTWNRFLSIYANKPLKDVIGCQIFEVFPELPKRWFQRKVDSVIQLKSPTFCSWEQRHHLFELPHNRPITTDSMFMAQNCTFLPYEEDGQLIGVCILIEDVTDVCHYQLKLKQTMQELELANRIDGLTQIYNRKYWEESLVAEFSRAKRYGSKLSLIMFDLDHFKRLNDNYGHQCGDLVLIETAKRIKHLLRDIDVLGRYGGEEFAIVLCDTALSGAAELAERIRKAVSSEPIEFEDKTIHFSVSIGVATLSTQHNSHEALISSADAELYKAKSLGRDQICVAQHLDECS